MDLRLANAPKKVGRLYVWLAILGRVKLILLKVLLQGLGPEDAGEVNSPTFVLVNEYEGGTYASGCVSY